MPTGSRKDRTMKVKVFLLTTLLMLVLAFTIVARIDHQKKSFDRAVQESFRTSAGYDLRLIGLVDRLETELATRARFGYEGWQDPMTGKKREVVIPLKPQKNIAASSQAQDPFKLTAIIADDKKGSYSAVVMISERSYAVSEGDVVKEYLVSKINQQGIEVQVGPAISFYDIKGNKETVH
jgi:hypothetical protein